MTDRRWTARTRRFELIDKRFEQIDKRGAEQGAEHSRRMDLLNRRMERLEIAVAGQGDRVTRLAGAVGWIADEVLPRLPRSARDPIAGGQPGPDRCCSTARCSPRTARPRSCPSGSTAEGDVYFLQAPASVLDPRTKTLADGPWTPTLTGKEIYSGLRGGARRLRLRRVGGLE